MNQQAIYVCRLCSPPMDQYSYGALRAHLRAVHRKNQLPNSELGLYESFPGSRYSQPPFAGTVAGAVEYDTNVDSMILLREDMVRTVAESIASNVQNIQVTAPSGNVNVGEILSAFHEMRESVIHTIGVNIKIGLKNAIKELSAQLDDSDDHNIETDPPSVDETVDNFDTMPALVPRSDLEMNISPACGGDSEPKPSTSVEGQAIVTADVIDSTIGSNDEVHSMLADANAEQKDTPTSVTEIIPVSKLIDTNRDHNVCMEKFITKTQP